MDFRDFFIFMIRFALANVVLLYQLTSSEKNINWSSSQVARLSLFNLKNIRCITLKMKLEAAWQNRGIAMINLMETIEDQSFVEFCNALGRTYSTIYKESRTDFSLNHTLQELKKLNLFDLFGSHIRNPDELVAFVDYAYKLAGYEG